MCGILGYIGEKEAPGVLVGGLQKLEYRGYDSAGLAVFNRSGMHLRRAVGKLSALQAVLKKHPVKGCVGLGHTRWATHGKPSEVNAHPHTDQSKRIVVVHNGIIENYLTLKKKLQDKGFIFKSETDTEVVAHLIASHWNSSAKKNADEKKNFIAAVQKALKEIKGTFALGILCTALPDLLIGARRDCPLIVGCGKGENFLASDVPAVLQHTRDVIFLEDGDLAILDRDHVEILNEHGVRTSREHAKINWNPELAEKSGYRHFMLKEIHEQPRTIEDTLLGRLQPQSGQVNLIDAGMTEADVAKIKKVRFVACGTSWHASLIGAFLIEKYSRLPVQVDIASEFRYRNPILEKGTLLVAISQSGETADTLAAVKMAREQGTKVLAVTNVIGSTLTRYANGSLLTHCGPEIGVASTKAFMGQLVALNLLSLFLAKNLKMVSARNLNKLGQDLVHLSQWVTETLSVERQVISIAKKYYQRNNFLFFGRNLNYPVALEGALKLKEISYIHAEGYPAGELKHGPIALIDEKMPVVAIATKSRVYEKMISNVEEAKSRGAEVIAIATKGDKLIHEKAAHVIEVPDVPEDLTPMINVIPLQLLSYHISLLRGCDVDQPRNLAKSVTVE